MKTSFSGAAFMVVVKNVRCRHHNFSPCAADAYDATGQALKHWLGASISGRLFLHQDSELYFWFISIILKIWNREKSGGLHKAPVPLVRSLTAV